MNGVRHLSIEAGPRCSMRHEWCPVSKMPARVATLTPEVAEVIIREALARGFTGEVGFHYYNEPTLYPDFIRRVTEAAPEARYVLWTNGAFLTDRLAARFGRIVVTDYGDLKPLPAHPNLGVIPCTPDARASIYESPEIREHIVCYRPSFEVPVDCTGRFHLCCEDWRGDVWIGDTSDIPAAFTNHARYRAALASGTGGPEVCRRCTNPVTAPME